MPPSARAAPVLIALRMPRPSSCAGHLEVGDDDVERARLAAAAAPRVGALGDGHRVAGAAQADREELAHRLLVVDDEDSPHVGNYDMIDARWSSSVHVGIRVERCSSRGRRRGGAVRADARARPRQLRRSMARPRQLADVGTRRGPRCTRSAATSRSTRFVLGAEYLPVRDLSIMRRLRRVGHVVRRLSPDEPARLPAAIVAWFAALCAFGLERRSSAIAVLLWALHPSHAESVAWIAERKGVLAALFAGARGARLRAVARRRRCAGSRSRRRAAVFAVWSKAPACSRSRASPGSSSWCPSVDAGCRGGAVSSGSPRSAGRGRRVRAGARDRAAQLGRRRRRAAGARRRARARARRSTASTCGSASLPCATRRPIRSRLAGPSTLDVSSVPSRCSRSPRCSIAAAFAPGRARARCSGSSGSSRCRASCCRCAASCSRSLPAGAVARARAVRGGGDRAASASRGCGGTRLPLACRAARCARSTRRRTGATR